MDNKTLHNHLWQLEAAIGSPHPAAQSVGDFDERLNDLRICAAYLLFDVEACRREAAFLRRALEGDGRR